jgi:hypothetical protein
VGYVPVLKPLLRLDDPIMALLISVVPVDPAPPTAPVLVPKPPAAVSPLVPPPAPCAKAMEEVIARTEAKAIVVSFMCCSLHRETVKSKATAPATGAGWAGAVLGVVPLGEPAHN